MLTILNLEFSVIKHPPYSPDLVPLDYHVFLQIDVNVKVNYDSFDATEVHLDDGDV